MNISQIIILFILIIITCVFIYFAINFESPDAMLTLTNKDNKTQYFDDDFM
jgi:hypothetical protein